MNERQEWSLAPPPVGRTPASRWREFPDDGGSADPEGRAEPPPELHRAPHGATPGLAPPGAPTPPAPLPGAAGGIGTEDSRSDGAQGRGAP